MKRTLLALALLVTIAAAGLAIYVTRTTDDPADPASAVRGMLDTYTSGNTAALENYFCDPAMADIILPDADTARYTFEDVSIREQERADNVAIVLLNATLHTGTNDAITLAWRLELTQRSNDWCISGVSTPSN